MNLDNKLLNIPTTPFDFENPPVDPTILVEQLVTLMIESKGVGLSANQVGLPYRVFVMGNPGDKESIIPVFNPTIINYSEETEYSEEGCLTYPGVWLKVKRPYAVLFEYEDEKGEKHQKELVGLPSRIFQHEYDHMEGTDFTQKVSRLKIDRAMKKLNKTVKRLQKLVIKTVALILN